MSFLCTCLTDYRTLIDSLKDFALFIEWYEFLDSYFILQEIKNIEN